MPLLEALNLRFACDQSARSGMSNIGTETEVIIYKGNPCFIQASVFTGVPSSGTFVNDLSNVSGASLLIRKHNAKGTVLVEKVLDPDEINGSLTYSEWLAGTGSQIEFELSDVDTNQTVPSDKTLDIYGAISISTPNGPITIGIFTGVIKDDGTGNPGEPVVPDYTSYSRAEIDNLLANISPDQGLGNVTGPNGSMIGHIAIFANGTGQLLDDSGILYTDLVVNSAVVHVTGNENVAGIKTFSSSPVVPNTTVGDDTGKIANTHFVTDAVSTLSTTLTTAIGLKQTGDPTLTALASVTTTADKLIYATASDTFATTTLTTFARTLLDDTDAATMRSTLGVGSGSGDVATSFTTTVDSEIALFLGTTGKALKRATGSGLALVTSGVLSTVTDSRSNWDTAYTDRLKWDGGLTGLVAATARTSLGLVIGTDVQAHDTDLDAIAAVSTQSFGIGLLTKSDASSVRAYLGVGTGSGDLSSAITSSTVGRLAVFSTTTGKGIGQIGTSASRGLATDIWIAIRPDGVDGVGTSEDPRNVYDTTSTLIAVKFDAIMATLGTYVRVRLFPGIYYTNHAARSWYVLNGWEIIGAGMYRTTVQSLGLGSDPAFHAPTSAGGASSVVIRDLSIDINWGGRANLFTDTTNSVGTLTLTSATTSSATVTATGRLVGSTTRDFDPTDIGRRVTGTGVPTNTWIGAVTATTITLSSSPVANIAPSPLPSISNGTVLTVKEKHATASAIYLCGNNNIVENVCALNGYGDAADFDECFWIGLCAGSTDGYNNHIRFCHAELPWGTYSAPFAIHGVDDGGAGVWNNYSSVFRCTATGVATGYHQGFTSGGVNMGFTRRCRVSECDFVDCFSIVYHDTGGYEDIEVSDNTLLRGSYGVAFDVTSDLYAAMTKKGVRVINNRIGLQNKLSGHSYGVILQGKTTESTSHVVSGNTITFLTTGGGYAHYYSVNSNSVSSKYINNICDQDDGSVLAGANTVISGNRTPAGGTVASLPDNRLQGFTLAAGEALRRKADDTAFETYTPAAASSLTGLASLSANQTFTGHNTIQDDQVDQDIRYQLNLSSTRAYNLTPKAGLRFEVKSDSGVQIAGIAGLYGYKANTTSGDYSGRLGFATTWFANNAATEHLTIFEDGGVSLANGAAATSPGASALQVAGVIKAGSTPTTLTDSAGKILSASLNTVGVAQGGTGDATLTAYAPLFGGTTSTGAVQSGTVGTSGQILTSNGAGALATFQTLDLSAVYQPLDSDLTSWALITRASGFDTFAATPSSANLAALLTDENGSGKVIFAAGTLAITSGKTATFSNTLTFAGTDGSTLNIGAGGTLGSNAYTSTSYAASGANSDITSTTALNTLTAASSTNLVLNGGSSGAAVTVGQGTNANVTLTPSGTGAVSLPAGTSAVMSLVFGSDTTGWYRNGANQWTWGSSGNPRISLIDSIIRMDGGLTFGFCSGNSTTASDVGIGRVESGGLEVNAGSGTSLGWLYAGRPVKAKTTAYSVTSANKNTFFTNAGASGSVNFTLPTAAAGLTYTFYVDTAQTLTITAGASTTIQLNSSVTASAGNLSASTVGNCVTLVAISTTKWVAECHEGTWTVT